MSMIKSYTQDGLQVTLETVFVNATPWICGKDADEALGYFPADQAIRNHVRAKWRTKLYELVGRDGLAHNDQNKWYISEPGFWQLAATVRTERAELFQDWLFETVLPNLRIKRPRGCTTRWTQERVLVTLPSREVPQGSAPNCSHISWSW